jgi:LPS O-antigen subunit length determinant protein (WzzB/FepE family)
MERIGVLINKLKEQYEQKADASQIAFTVQLLQTELAQWQANGNKMLGTSKVSVMMPKTLKVSAPESTTPVKVKETTIEIPPVWKQKEPEMPVSSSYKLKETQESDYDFDPLLEIPTLSHQKSVKELNEAIAIREESLNEKLKQEQTELFEVLKDTPVRDLRKAIGINDRFVFINELFRGDEPMYERSIKTINSFHIYAEAEYWINRELKTKLGWNDKDENARHFYQLVKRRFS